MQDDPRDKGFNYGKGWGSDPKPFLYHQAMKLSRILNQEAQEASKRAWQLEHALWRVRIATTGVEKAAALKELSVYVTALTAFELPTIESAKVAEG